MAGADLHAHTLRSDGTLSPSELVDAALEAGLDTLAVTDHDSVAGVGAAVEAARDTPLEVVPGIEISSALGKREVHILGLFVDPTDGPLLELTERQAVRRRERAERMVARVRDRGIDLRLEDVETVADGAPIGRPHIARALLAAGAVDGFQQAFRQLIGIGRPCFVPKELPGAGDVIVTIHAAAGVAVVAHPGSSRVRDRALHTLAEAGLDGIEVRHPRHGRQRERILMRACGRLSLLPSGGSDYHGPGRGNSELGEYRIPGEWVDDLRDRSRRYGRSAGG